MIGLACFFFNDTATTEIYTLSLHDALPISCLVLVEVNAGDFGPRQSDDHPFVLEAHETRDRKSTRLNSSHSQISYAVFCLKKKHGLQEAHRGLQAQHPAAHPRPQPRRAQAH